SHAPAEQAPAHRTVGVSDAVHVGADCEAVWVQPCLFPGPPRYFDSRPQACRARADRQADTICQPRADGDHAWPGGRDIDEWLARGAAVDPFDAAGKAIRIDHLPAQI